MDKAELFTDIRTLLMEPQTDTVSEPQTYSDDQLVDQVRSAFRRFRIWGLSVGATMASDGTLSDDLDEAIGVLTSLWVAQNLLRGDLTNKVLSGQFGVVWEDLEGRIDTKEAAKRFETAADEYRSEFDSLKTILLTRGISAVGSTFGDDEPAERS